MFYAGHSIGEILNWNFLKLSYVFLVIQIVFHVFHLNEIQKENVTYNSLRLFSLYNVQCTFISNPFVDRRDNFKLGVGLRVFGIGFWWKFMIKNVVVIYEKVHLWLCFFAEDCFCEKYASWIVIRDLLLLQSWVAKGDLMEVVTLYGFWFGWKCMTKGGRQ
jgi:hypothetical protein